MDARDFTHAATCGCRIVFTARSDYAQSFMQSCGPHSTRMRAGLWREALAYAADQDLDAWQLAGRPEITETAAE